MQQGILSGPEILREIEQGIIKIDPFNPKHVNPASFDLTLGKQLAVYEDWVKSNIQTDKPIDGSLFEKRNQIMNMSKQPSVVHFDIPETGFVLLPGILYLMHTAERVCTESYVPVLDGKSSIGRLGLKVHETAGYGDPGFDGQYTLEVTTMHPIRVYEGVRFCQIRFHTIRGEVSLYQNHQSNYKGELASGPVPSRAWKMFTR